MTESNAGTTPNGLSLDPRPGSTLTAMNEQVVALIAAIDELRAAQDALAGALMRRPAPANFDRLIADLVRDAQTAANAVRIRAEQDAAGIRRLARAETDEFLADLSHLQRQLAAARTEADLPAPPAPTEPLPGAATPEPAPSPETAAPPPETASAPSPAPDAPPPTDEPSPVQQERDALIASLREEREGLKRELQRIHHFDPAVTARATADARQESWFSRLFAWLR